MIGSYGPRPGRRRQPPPDAAVALLAAAAFVGARITRGPSAGVVAVAVATGVGLVLVPGRGARLVLLAMAVSLGAAVRADSAWDATAHGPLGDVRGPARLITDPTPRAGAVQVVLEIEGHRYEVWARGSAARRLRGRLAGQLVWVEGERVSAGSSSARLAVRHVVGRLRVERVGAWSAGRPLDRAANRARSLVSAGVRTWAEPEAALFLGLVLGDDRGEPASMVDAFRTSGLAHLTAASGQNIAFVVAAAGPFLRRLRPWWRLAATVAVIGWFVVLARGEPSVLRAAVTAGLGAFAYTLGRDRAPLRLLSLATLVLLAVDPLLAWSVSFLLSVSATAGLVVLAGPIARVLPGPAWMRAPVGVTVAAQVGVAPVVLAVFGTLPIVAVPANLLAVPVAGAVMLVGLPVALVAALLPVWAAALVTWPVQSAVRWVWTVAELGARLDPPLLVDGVGWVLLIGALALAVRRARAEEPSR